MADQRVSIHGQWSSRLAFIMAATGSAVGLGNIWKFPYVAGENGGGAFVLVYLACIALIGLPVMMAEILIGRRGACSPINTMRHLARDEGRNPSWQLIGFMGIVAGFLIISFYSVIAGWVMAYVPRIAAGMFDNVTSDGASAIFGDLVSDPERMLAWHTLFMLLTAGVVARGVEEGLERAVRWLMPLLFILLLVMLGYAMNTDAFMDGVDFLFRPDFAALSLDGVLAAMGQAFFSLSLGMGAIMMYGSYLPKDANITSSAVTIALSDTLVAIVAGMVIFPIVFSNQLDPAAGPSLIFQTLPLAFGHMPAGALFGTLFFVLLVVAAWTSAISLIEPVVAWMVESLKWSRIRATVVSALIAWVLGIGTIVSFNIGADVLLFGKTFFDLLDFLTTNILLPLGGLFIALFAAWMVRREVSRAELSLGVEAHKAWRILAGVVAPAGVVVIFLSGLGIFGS
ncbi:MAG: sodium-dependent transporter [Gammaproteobacteria bacterium]